MGQRVRACVRAYLGTGLIGEGLALAALGRGERVRTWNRTADKTRSIVAAGGEALSTPEDAVAGTTIVHLALTADGAVDALLDRIADHVGDAIVVDHSMAVSVRSSVGSKQCRFEAVSVRSRVGSKPCRFEAVSVRSSVGSKPCRFEAVSVRSSVGSKQCRFEAGVMRCTTW